MWRSLSGQPSKRKLHWWVGKGRMFIVSQCGLLVAKHNLKEGDYPKCKHCEKVLKVRRLK